jgi:enoyl-CoA hydratase
MTTGAVTLQSEKDGIYVVTLNRPQERNAMNQAMADEFYEAVSKIRSDSQARAVVMTGAGGAFCAGADLGLLPLWQKEPVARIQRSMFDFYGRFLSATELEIPTIAAVGGPAIGAGACLALSCDMRIASEDAVIAFSFIKLGLNPGMGAEYFLTRLAGPAVAMELLLTGNAISAREALRLGLVNRVVPPGELLDQSLALARQIADMPTLPVRVIKASAYAASRATLKEVLQKQAAFQSICYQSGDVEEGVRAIRERRAPRFSRE